MAGSINKVILIGRLGRDPEMRYTPGGKAVTNFTMATSESWKDDSGEKQEHTEWHRIVMWGKMAELADKHLSKGSQVYIEGKISTKEWTDKEGVKRYTTEIVASHMTFLGEKGEGKSHEAPADDSADPCTDIPF